MPDPTTSSTTSFPSDVVTLELTIAKTHLRNARALAQQQQEPSAACARITLALDATQDALDYRTENRV